MGTSVVEETRANKVWRPEELAYLSRHYGILSDEEICQFLKRPSRNALKIAAYRLLNGLKRKDNFYCSAEAARSLGVRDSKTIVGWVNKGWLPYQKGPMFQGLHRVWSFSEQDIINCLRRRPYLVDLKRVKQYIFCRVIQEEWEKDPWYTSEECFHVFGVSNIDPVHRYIHIGWLPAEKKPGGPWQGIWIIRHSAIEQFLKNDPRLKHKIQALRKSRQKMYLAKGNPVRVCTTWLLKCPSCHKEVEIVAPGNMRGPLVKKTFVRLFVNGNCFHEDICYLDGTKPTDPAPCACPKCGSLRLYKSEDGLKCWNCAKIIYR